MASTGDARIRSRAARPSMPIAGDVPGQPGPETAGSLDAD